MRLTRQQTVRSGAADRVRQVERRPADVSRHRDDGRQLAGKRILCSGRERERGRRGGNDETSAKHEHDRRSPVADLTGIYTAEQPGSRTFITLSGRFVTVFVPERATCMPDGPAHLARAVAC